MAALLKSMWHKFVIWGYWQTVNFSLRDISEADTRQYDVWDIGICGDGE